MIQLFDPLLRLYPKSNVLRNVEEILGLNTVYVDCSAMILRFFNRVWIAVSLHQHFSGRICIILMCVISIVYIFGLTGHLFTWPKFSSYRDRLKESLLYFHYFSMSPLRLYIILFYFLRGFNKDVLLLLKLTYTFLGPRGRSALYTLCVSSKKKIMKHFSLEDHVISTDSNVSIWP